MFTKWITGPLLKILGFLAVGLAAFLGIKKMGRMEEQLESYEALRETESQAREQAEIHRANVKAIQNTEDPDYNHFSK